ncbi:MAG TPA: amidohydrolase [Solirubrobacteraceae bacterium]|nr:amidohydrolase [Solirubrobacteraceae bacterium]
MTGTAGLLVVGADVRTLDPSRPRAQALALAQGRVLATGAEAELQRLRAADTRVLDAGGATVLPGLIDAHGHFGHVARSMATAVDCRTPPVRSVADILDRARERAHSCAPGTWILLQGTTFQDELVEDRRFPLPVELSAVAPEHPVVYRSSLHHLILNSRALRDAGLDADTPTPAGAQIDRDPETGAPTGVMAEMFDHLPIPPATEAQLAASIERTAWEHYLANGVTSIQEVWDSAGPMELIARAQRAGELPLRVRGLGWVGLAGTVAEVASGRIGDVPLREEWMEGGGVKLFADGGTSSHTAAFYDEYLDAPGSRGVLSHELGELVDAIGQAQRAGAQVAVHACGDLATDLTLAAFELAGTSPSSGLRPRIEHGANTAWSKARSAWCERLGVLPVANLGFIHNYGVFWPRSLGPARSRGCVPLRTLLDAGFPVPGTSDTTGGDPRLLNPFHNMWCAVTRETFAGRTIDPEQRITREEALTMYTRHAAHAGHWESSRGMLAPGLLGDAIVLDRALEGVADEELAQVRVAHTIVAGELVYSQGARVCARGGAPGRED